MESGAWMPELAAVGEGAADMRGFLYEKAGLGLAEAMPEGDALLKHESRGVSGAACLLPLRSGRADRSLPQP